MRFFPWRGGETDRESPADSTGEDAVHSCVFQDGTLSVYEDRVRIERPDRSRFDDKWIALNQIRDVTYAGRLVISYIQIEQDGVENDEGGRLSTPVDENTLHFGRGKRDCAREARDAILAGMTAA